MRAPFPRVASLLRAEFERLFKGEPCEAGDVQFENVDAVFRSVETLTNVGTLFFALPTRGEWTVLWNNTYLCDGYDSLCHNLTRLHGVETLHWSSSDLDGPFQAGTQFSHRSPTAGGEVTRSVYCCRNDSHWVFSERGQLRRLNYPATISERKTADVLWRAQP